MTSNDFCKPEILLSRVSKNIQRPQLPTWLFCILSSRLFLPTVDILYHSYHKSVKENSDVKLGTLLFCKILEVCKVICHILKLSEFWPCLPRFWNLPLGNLWRDNSSIDSIVDFQQPTVFSTFFLLHHGSFYLSFLRAKK